MRGNYKTRFRGEQNLTAVEENASVFQVNTVSRINIEGRAEFLRTWDLIFDQKEYIKSKFSPAVRSKIWSKLINLVKMCFD